jgi:hypothetical protein
MSSRSLTALGGSRTIDIEPIHVMRDMRAKRLSAVLIGLLLAGGAVRVWSQSLGDVAKKEQERRKNTPSSGKVYTNKDLGSVPPPSTPPPAAAAGDAKPADSKTADKDAPKDDKDAKKDDKDAAGKDKDQAGPKGQEYWSKRRRALQDTLDRDSTFADALQSRINALTTDFVNRDDPAQRATIERDRQKAIAELDRLKRQITEDRKAIADLEEEARRAGVPPGWLR